MSLNSGSSQINSRFNSKIIVYLLIAAVSSFLLSLVLLEILFGIVAVAWMLEKFEDKKKAFDIFTILVLIFGGVRVISIIFSQFPSVSIQAFYKEALFYLSFFSLSFYLKAIGKDKTLLISNSFVIAAILISLIGLILFNFKLVERAASFSSGYATFSSYIVTALGLALMVSYIRIKEKNWLLWSLGIVLILSAIITSMGRTNIAVAGLLLVCSIIFRKIDLRSFVLIASLTALISLFSFNNNKFEVNNRIENPSVLSDRNVLYEGAAMLIGKHTFIGFGPRTFHEIFPLFNKLTDKGIGSWHNDFIQIYFESGIIGLFSFILLTFIPIIEVVKIIKKNSLEAGLKNLLLGILFGMIALILSSLTAGFIDSPILSIVFAFLISALSAVKYYQVRDA